MQAGISGEPALLIPERRGRRLRQDGEGAGLARVMGGLAGRMCGPVGEWEGEEGARRTGGPASTAETRRSARLLRRALLRRLRGGKQAAAHLALGEG